ncbi:hypothetical protein OS493_021669 [Desmophyllum pertusum]|uniref:Uncharacterized protein n=1 Tax=Desmophyllum pertusum TaxID=174260 RepID=A0A9X0CED0_9CNID|nr:hypothetical protein OS493_021669 [Desmophyllum pertusum]
MVPYVHLIKHCDDLGIPADKSSTLYLFIGIFASLGRLGAGFLCNMKFIKARHIHQAAAFTVGTSTMLLTLAKTYASIGRVCHYIQCGRWNDGNFHYY